MSKKIFLMLALTLALTGSNFAATYYVAAGAAGTGASWSDAFGSLDSALAVAASGDTVLVAAGNYIPSGASFSVAAGVTVKGGYNNFITSYGNVTNIGEFYNPSNYPVVLSGDTNSDDAEANLYGSPDALDALPSRAENKTQIMVLAGTATIEGVTFYHGGAAFGANGAGLGCAASGTATVSNCQFLGNVGTVAAVYLPGGGTLAMSNCWFEGNAASQSVVRLYGTATITGCTFKGNSNSGEVSNGIQISGGTSVTISNCVVVDSITGLVSSSGSLYARLSTVGFVLNVSNTVFRNDGGDGGCHLLRSDVSGGTQTYNLTNVLWAKCQEHTSNGTVIMRNRYPAGSTTFNFVNCTMADCQSTGNGGFKAYSATGLLNTSMVINIKNSILWGNSGAQVLWDTSSLSFTDTTYNPFKISYSCIDTVDPNNYPAINPISGIPTGLIVANPQFVGNGDYHLQSTSPCIDKGDPASSYANEPKWLNGCRVNMGAYGNTKEAATTTTCVALTADTNGDCRVNNADLLTLRGQWLKTCP